MRHLGCTAAISIYEVFWRRIVFGTEFKALYFLLHSFHSSSYLTTSPAHQRRVCKTFSPLLCGLLHSITLAPTLSSSSTTTRNIRYNDDCNFKLVTTYRIKSFFKKFHDLQSQAEIGAFHLATNICLSIFLRLAAKHLEQLHGASMHYGFCFKFWPRRYIL